MALDLLGYELTGTLAAVATLVIIALEAIVLYVVYTGLVRLADQMFGTRGPAEREP